MCADKIYLQRRIQTATENILNQLTRDVDIQIREIKKTKLSDSNPRIHARCRGAKVNNLNSKNKALKIKMKKLFN